MTAPTIPTPATPVRRIRAAEPARRRTLQKVRRRSVLSGDWEKGWIRPMSWGEKHELLRAARAYDRKNKKPGDRHGPIGSIGLELLEEICTLAVTCRGKVWPTLQWLQDRLRRSRDTIVRYKAALAELGILEWVRRMVPAETEADGLRGQVVEQISNIYRLAMPKALRKLARRSPPPADDAARRAAMAEALRLAAREEAGDGLDAAIERGRRRAEASNRARRSEPEGESDRPSQSTPNRDL